LAIMHSNQGALFVSQDKYEEAVAEYTKAIEILPDNASAYTNRGIIYLKNRGGPHY
jgi:Flp pilus assembly protein TadD